MEDRLERLVGWFDQSEEATRDARRESELHRDYYDGKQWTSDEQSKLLQRGQAPVVDNRVKDKVDYLLGLERTMRTDPKAFPRNPTDDGAAEAATDALRYVVENNDFDQVRSEIVEDYLIEGTGVAEIIVETRNDEPVISINHIFWDRFFHDPYSRRRDFADARYLGQAIWMDYDQAVKKYGDKEILEASKGSTTPLDETYEDKPSRWWDSKRNRLRILEIYYKEGAKCMRAVFCRGGYLEKPEESIYLDEDGLQTWPYEAQSAFVDRDGNRYGIVRRYKDLQDELNKRRSKFLDATSRRNVIMDKGAVDDVNVMRNLLAQPDGAIEKKRGFDFQVLPNTDIANGHFTLLQQTLSEFAQVGPHAVLSGTGGSESGRSKQIDQQGAVIQLGTLMDGVRAWQKRVYRKAWQCVKQFWTDEKWVRVRDLDEVSGVRFVPLNYTDPNTGEMLNKVAELDLDIIVEEAPDVISLQQETFEMMTLLAKSGAPIAPELLIELSPLPSSKKRMALERLQPQPEQQQKQAIAEQMQMAAGAAEIAETQADAEKKRASAYKTTVDAQGKEIENYLRGLGL